MRVSINRRLVALEAKIKPERAGSGLGREIKVMTQLERNALRDFLLYAKNGGQSGNKQFDNLKHEAEIAVFAARERLGQA
jgi:hypothetical protein